MKKLLFFIGFVSLISAEQKRFVIDICSYNNAQWFEKNISSVLEQNYPSSHFRVIYTDDKSPDGTGDLVEKYLKDNDQNGQVLLIKNKERRRALANHYNAIHLCDDDEIILTLDGDDWLAHKNVLHNLNELYNKNDIWFAYSRFENWPKKGSRAGGAEYSRAVPEDIINHNAYRKYTWVCGQLRTFYAWLAKGIKLEDLILSKPLRFDKSLNKKFLGLIEKLSSNQLKRAYKSTNEFIGTFFPSACDVALMIPMLEMAGKRIAYIDEPIYIRNLGTDINDHKVDPSMQLYCARYIREFNEYQPLKILKKQTPSEEADIFQILFLDDLVFEDFKDENLKDNTAVLKYEDELNKDELVARLEIVGEYVFVGNVNQFCNNINFKDCVNALKLTHAHAYYFNKPKKGTPYDSLFGANIYFWQYAFCKPKSGSALYHKESIIKAIKNIEVKTVRDFYQALPDTYTSLRNIGLFSS